MFNAAKRYLYTGLSAIGVLIWVALASPAKAANIATFDSFSEGFLSPDFTDGGIRFFDLDDRGLGNNIFSIDSTNQLHDPFFSSPNVLSFQGYSPGPGFGFGRFGSMKMTTGRVESSASLDIFYPFMDRSQSVLTLEALLNGKVVGSNSINFDFLLYDDSAAAHKTLSISGLNFDELRLVASGPQNQGAALFAVDNVRIDGAVGVPEPSSEFDVLALGAVGAVLLLKRKKQIS